MKSNLVNSRKAFKNPRDVRPEDYDQSLPLRERLIYLINYAVLAPSTHNTQPWLFRVSPSSIDILADRSRALPVIDPDDRSLLISCGATAGTLAKSLEAVGIEFHVVFLPDPKETDLVARIEVDGEGPIPENWNTILGTIRARKSVRKGFLRKSLKNSELQFLNDVKPTNDVIVEIVQEFGTEQLVLKSVFDSETTRLLDKHYLRENASWKHPFRTRSKDGIPDTLGTSSSTPSLWAPENVDDATGADSTIRFSRVMVVMTPQNRPLNWVQSGFQMAYTLVEVTSHGLSAAIVSHPFQNEEVRFQVEALTESDWAAQILLRIGYAEHASLTPRRALLDVLMHPGFAR